MEVNWGLVADFAPAIVLGIPAFFVWRIHKENQNVRMHKIGKLSEKEMSLLGSKLGNSWMIKEGEYVRAMPGYAHKNETPPEIYPLDENGKTTSEAPYGETVPVMEYSDAMGRLLLYGLMEQEIYKDGLRMTRVFHRSVYGQFEYQRQSAQKCSLAKRVIRWVLEPMMRWTYCNDHIH